MSSELLPQLSIVVVFRVLRAGKQDIESQMGLAHIMKVLYAHSSAQTISHRNETGGWLGERRMEGRGGKGQKKDVQNVCLFGGLRRLELLRDGHMFRSHWATHRATLRRCWRDKTATRGKEPGHRPVDLRFLSLSFQLPSLFFRPPSARNRTTANWSWNAGWGEHKPQRPVLSQRSRILGLQQTTRTVDWIVCTESRSQFFFF